MTKESLIELFKEVSEIAGNRPVTEAELAFAKERIILGFPGRFETTFGVAGQLAILVADELPDDELDRYQSRIEAVTRADVDRVAQQYITPETMTILVVGDRSQIEGPLKTLPFVKAIRRLDAEGNPLPDAAPRVDNKYEPVPGLDSAEHHQSKDKTSADECRSEDR